MPDQPDGMQITTADFAQLTTPEQAVNFVEHKIKVWADWTLKKPPPPGVNDLAGRQYLIWERRLMMAYGEIVGAMQALHAVGKIDARQFKALKHRVIAAVTRKAGSVQMGVDP
jgi:hypothetical protein